MTGEAIFDKHQQAWGEYTSSPWARIRYAVVGHTLERSLSDLGPGPHRILDVGGGDGADALPLAAAGHEVTVLDPSETMLAAAAAKAEAAGLDVVTVLGGLSDAAGLGEYDAVLCHFVLQYRPDERADVAALAPSVRPGGLLSVVLPNPVGQALARLVREGPVQAMDELGRDVIRTVTFDRDVRKVSVGQGQDALEAAGLRVVGRYGGRIANDLLTDDAAKHGSGYFEDLLRLELALCDQDPYRNIGAFWQLVAVRG